MNSKKENYEDFCLDFIQELGLGAQAGKIQYLPKYVHYVSKLVKNDLSRSVSSLVEPLISIF